MSSFARTLQKRIMKRKSVKKIPLYVVKQGKMIWKGMRWPLTVNQSRYIILENGTLSKEYYDGAAS